MALARGMSVRTSLDTHETCVSSCVETLKTMEPSLLKPDEFYSEFRDRPKSRGKINPSAC